MPKLRLRVASTGATFKLELPDGCNWAGLQAEARRAVGLPADGDVTLSLNKKVPLGGSPDDPLSSLGVCNGDLLWLVAPEVAPATAAAAPAAANTQPATPPPAPASPAQAVSAVAAPPTALRRPPVPVRTAPGPAAAAPGPGPAPAAGGGFVPGRRDSGGGAAPGAAAQGAVQQQHPPAEGLVASGGGGGGGGGGEGAGGGGGSQGMEVDTAAEGEEADMEEADGPYDGRDVAAEGEAAFLGLRGVSLKLLRLLLPPSSSSKGAAEADSSGRGGGGSSSGGGGSASYPPSSSPSSVWLSLPAVARCLLVLDCAMAEAGFEGVQDLPALAAQAGALPRQLLFGCSHITGTAVAAAAAATAASASSGDQPMAEPACATAPPGAGGGSGGDGIRHTAAAAAPAVVVVKLLWYCMGKYLVVHGVPCIGSAAASSRSPVSLHVDLSEYGADVAPTAAPPAEQQEQQQKKKNALLLPSDPAGHWRRLKDELVLPLLAAACRAAGAPPPLGLTVLPLELQMAVLRRLEVRDLAALSGVCSALHHLASEDELWRPLYDKEFGGLPAADAALANTRGFKYVYGRRWRERSERRKRRQVFRPAAPPVWGPPPLAPFFRPPFMPPGSIGGEYDRIPAPLMGGGGGVGGPPAILGAGRGMFGGGGGGGGGLQGPGFPGLGRRPGRPWGGGGIGGGFF